MAGFLFAYVLVGVAALHPSIAEVGIVEPKPVPNIYRRSRTAGTHAGRRLRRLVPPSILLIASGLDASVGVP